MYPFKIMKRLKLLSLLTVFALVVAPVVSVFVRPAKAAAITDLHAGEYAASHATAKTVTFTPNTTISSGSTIEVTYDTSFTGGAALVDGDVSVSGGTLSCTESSFVAGYFKSTCSGSSSTLVTITIGSTNFLTAPASSGNYPWSVTVDIGGAGTTYDYGAGLAYIADDNDVEVTAIVPPTIDMELYQTGVDAELVDPNTCPLGVLSLNQVNTCTYDIGTGTNNAAGLTIQVTSDGTLDDGSSNDIDACSGTNCDGKGSAAVTAGQEEYGFYISELGNSEYTAAGSYGTNHQPVPTSATTFATTASTGSGTNSGEIAQRLEVTHAASMDTATVVGSYDQTVTYTAYTN